MHNFKRDNAIVENAKQIAETLEENKKNAILLLIDKYEKATYSEWSDKPKFTANVIDGFVNDFGFADDLVAETMANNHPTLQQSFMRLCVKFIKKMSEKPHWDGRNEASVKMAKKMMDVLEGETGLPCI